MKMNISKKSLCLASLLVASIISCNKPEIAAPKVNVTESVSVTKETALAAGALTIPPKTIPTADIRHLMISDDYRVEARVTGTSTYFEVPVYKTDNYAVASGSDRRPQTSASFANFSFPSGTSIDVRITTIKKPITTYRLKPKSYNIASTKNTWQVMYTINTNRKIAFINDNDKLNPLFVYGNPPEPAAETSSGGTTYTYNPGTVTDIGFQKAIHSNDRINIRAGAIVQGTFNIDAGATNVKFIGQGILTSGNVAFNATTSQVVENCTFAGTGNFSSGVSYVTWDGLNIVNAAGWVFGCMMGWTSNTGHKSHHNTMRDLKQVHWNPQTDAIWFDGDDNTVSDCFLFTNDDITTHGSYRCTLSDLVVWQGGNGGHLFMQDNWTSSDDIVYDGIDLIGQDNVMETILVKATQNNTVSINNVAFKNINVEERTGPSSYWKNRFFSMSNPGKGKFTVNNFTFSNVKIATQQTATNGEGILAPNGTATGLKFINFYFGDNKMTSLEQARITKNANVATPVFQ
jgi:hypothetical protein